MSRACYSEDGDDMWALIRWRGQVKSAIRGKRGQAFLREMVAALDALPAPRLVANDLAAGGEVCALGAVGLRRGIDMADIDPEDYEQVAKAFGLPHQLAREIEYENDDGGAWSKFEETPEDRFKRMREWVVNQIIVTPEEAGAVEIGGPAVSENAL